MGLLLYGLGQPGCSPHLDVCQSQTEVVPTRSFVDKICCNAMRCYAMRTFDVAPYRVNTCHGLRRSSGTV